MDHWISIIVGLADDGSGVVEAALSGMKVGRSGSAEGVLSLGKDSDRLQAAMNRKVRQTNDHDRRFGRLPISIFGLTIGLCLNYTGNWTAETLIIIAGPFVGCCRRQHNLRCGNVVGIHQNIIPPANR